MTGETELIKASQDFSKRYDGVQMQGVARGSYNIGRTFLGTSPNTSVKSEYTREDYEYYRPYESTPKSIEESISMAMRAYKKVGIVRNVMDLMSDFTCKGIQIIHPNPQQEKFFKQWWEYINGDSTSERFANYLYRIGNVVVNTTFGKVPVSVERRWTSAYGEEAVIKEIKAEHRRIPVKYTFLNPAIIEVFAPEVATFIGSKPIYLLRLSSALRVAFARLESQYPMIAKEDILKMVPKYVMDAIKSGKNLLPIDGESINVFHYKKDEWDIWAEPMVSSIIDDLIMLEKMKLADMSALDGAISNIRLWKLGKMEGDNPNNWYIPTTTMINKLRNILANNTGGGTMDLVWGPDITFQMADTNVHNFLGSSKYEPVLANIYEGLGVPMGSRGSSSAGSGMTNNFISMQTFVERLEYGRRILLDFWNKEIKRVQLAMGYSKPAEIIFEQINLGDDTSYKTLLISLLDRDIIGVDTVLDSFHFSKIEKKRVTRDYQQRVSGKLPNKASPFHSPMEEHELKKIILQRGGVAPSEVGLGLKERKEGEKSPNEQTEESQLKLAEVNNQAKIQQAKYKPSAPNGRPKAKKDSGPRKTKTPPIRTKADSFVNTFIWGNEAQQKISDIVTPVLLSSAFQKKNVRSLTSDEFKELEEYKFLLFSNLQPFEPITEERVSGLSLATNFNTDVAAAAQVLKLSFQSKNGGREPTVDEMRQIQSSGFALAHHPEEETREELDDFDSSQVTPA